MSDDTIVARIIGAAARHAWRCVLTEAEHLAAVTEIAGLAGGRADLLAQSAGIAAGFHCRRADEARSLRAAQLCIEAGADTGQVHHRAEEGRRRVAITWQEASPPAPPRSGPLADLTPCGPGAAGIAGLARRPDCALRVASRVCRSPGAASLPASPPATRGARQARRAKRSCAGYGCGMSCARTLRSRCRSLPCLRCSSTPSPPSTASRPSGAWMTA